MTASNICKTLAFLALFTLGVAQMGAAQSDRPASSNTTGPSKVEDTFTFVAGAAAGLLIHESGHLLFNGIFDGQPRLKKVSFGGIPFFAITHRGDLSPRREFTVSSAGFWMQHLTSEWLLTKRPHLREERAWGLKGLLAFNVLTSVAYSSAAFARAGPHERDTRSMAESRGISERWIGVLVLAPAVLDGYRFFRSDAGDRKSVV